jgi:hypothetical protein
MMKDAIYIALGVAIILAAFKYADYRTGQLVKNAQLGAIGL